MREYYSVCYFASWPVHLANAVVSIASLRRYYAGPVVLKYWPESRSIVEEIARDRRLDVVAELFEPEDRGSNANFIEKTRLLHRNNGRIHTTVFLDSDTLIFDSIDQLFRDCDGCCGFACTQFGDWWTSRPIIKSRIASLHDIAGIDQELVDRLLIEVWPSLNNGIFSAKSDSPVLSVWKEWTKLARNCFIPDEIVLHLLLLKFQCTGNFFVSSGQYNTSPKHHEHMQKHAKILHFHGGSNLRLAKCKPGVDLWFPYFQDVMNKNLGGIRQWYGSIGNVHLANLLQQPEYSLC